jgi:hypothetical protein
MSACQFKINFSGAADEILAKAKDTVEKQGGQFSGDTQNGQFSITLLSNTVAGTYIVNGNELEISIDQKPIFVPCSAIEGYLVNKLK